MMPGVSFSLVLFLSCQSLPAHSPGSRAQSLPAKFYWTTADHRSEQLFHFALGSGPRGQSCGPQRTASPAFQKPASPGLRGRHKDPPSFQEEVSQFVSESPMCSVRRGGEVPSSHLDTRDARMWLWHFVLSEYPASLTQPADGRVDPHLDSFVVSPPVLTVVRRACQSLKNSPWALVWLH